MKIVSSYKVQVFCENSIFRDTVRLYRSALSFLIGVFHSEWSALQNIKNAKERFNAAEHFIHETKRNSAKYDFDVRFPKMPSYLRRAVTQEALGCVSSYIANHTNWVTSGKQGKEPKLQVERFAMPTFYNKEMYSVSEDPYSAYLKLYCGNDWVWVKVQLRGTDVRYLKRYWQHCKPSAPTLEKRYGKYYLRFAFTEKVEFSETPVLDQRICAVDLGLNSDAVCSIISADGTVLARKFVNFPSEKDHLWHVLNRIRRYQREHGSQNVQSFWKYARRLNDELAKKIASAITDFAVLYSVDCVVFEYLDFRGKKAKGSKAQRIQMWRKNGIQQYAEHKAHRCGIRVSHICAWGTSKLAFDGSGEIVRDETNRALCTFRSGKRYNCDLSASYNIGARYFIRELLKPLSAMARSDIEAKVPGCQRRTSNTLSTLRALTAVLKTA
ncbi:IS200/IS605 family accessory protein TnpB-related protein [Candidatus Allofournierella merdipullorum]|uniref:IS200/IS605 family accessory protein TnpB-related protein n=1 Tax=Candidatus Allofournierella merdipullorum TaxID=2838595 RepID=UPI00374F5C1A